jgi:hypothetical protein
MSVDYNENSVRSAVPTAVAMRDGILWHLRSYSLVNVYLQCREKSDSKV